MADEVKPQPLSQRAPEAFAALVKEVQDERYKGMTPDEIATALHAPSQETTTPPPVPRPLSLLEVMGALSAESVAKLLAMPCFVDCKNMVTAQNREGVGLYAAAFAKAGAITPEEYGTVTAILSATDQPPDAVTLGKSRFDIALKYVKEMPNKIRAADVLEAQGVN